MSGATGGSAGRTARRRPGRIVARAGARARRSGSDRQRLEHVLALGQGFALGVAEAPLALEELLDPVPGHAELLVGHPALLLLDLERLLVHGADLRHDVAPFLVERVDL